MISETDINNRKRIILRIKQNYLNADANFRSLKATYNPITENNVVQNKNPKHYEYEEQAQEYFYRKLSQRELVCAQGLLNNAQKAYMEACIKDCDAKQIEINFIKCNHGYLQGLKQNYEDSINNYNAIVEKYGQFNAIKTVVIRQHHHRIFGIRLVEPLYSYHDEIYFDLEKYNKSLDYAKTIEERARIVYKSFGPESSNAITKKIAIYAKAQEIKPNIKKKAEVQKEILEAYKLIELDPSDPFAYNKKGRALNALGSFEKAIDEFDSAISFNSSILAFFHNKGNALKTLGRLEDALEEYNKGIAVELTTYRLENIFNNKRDVLKILGRFEEATEIDEEHSDVKKVQYYSNDIVFLNKKHHTVEELGKFENDISACDRIIAKNIYYINAYNAKGNILKILGRFEEAILSYDMAITKNPNYALYHLNKAQLLQQLGREEEALDPWSKGYEICKLLIAEKSGAKFVSQNGWTSLGMLVQSGNIKMCESLIIGGAEVNSVGKNGSKPLDIAMKSGNIEMCKLLIEAGADVNLNSYGPLRDLPDASREILIQIKKNVDHSHGLFCDALKNDDFSAFLNQPISLMTRYLSYKKYFDTSDKIFPSIKNFKAFLEQNFDENGNHIQSYNTKFSSDFFALPRQIFEREVVIHNKGYDTHFLNDFYCSRLKCQVLGKWDDHNVFAIKELMGLISSYLSPNDIVDLDNQIIICMIGVAENSDDSDSTS